MTGDIDDEVRVPTVFQYAQRGGWHSISPGVLLETEGLLLLSAAYSVADGQIRSLAAATSRYVDPRDAILYPVPPGRYSVEAKRVRTYGCRHEVVFVQFRQVRFQGTPNAR